MSIMDIQGPGRLKGRTLSLVCRVISWGYKVFANSELTTWAYYQIIRAHILAVSGSVPSAGLLWWSERFCFNKKLRIFQFKACQLSIRNWATKFCTVVIFDLCPWLGQKNNLSLDSSWYPQLLFATADNAIPELVYWWSKGQNGQ